jgi:hypothetical protein
VFVKKGSTRIIVGLPRWGYVIKLPRPQPVKGIRSTYEVIKLGRKTGEMTYWLAQAFGLEAAHDNAMNIRYTLLRGIWQNWEEYRLWRRTGSRCLEPTRFSLFGLINIQTFGPQQRPVTEAELRSQLARLTDGLVKRDWHHFANPHKFSYRRSVLRLRNYSGPVVRTVVERYGEHIARSFRLYDPAPP